MLRHLLRALAYLGYLVLAVVAIVYLVFWLPYRLEIAGQGPNPDTLPELNNMPPAVMRQVGSYRFNGELSSFTLAAFDKPEGGIRICALGDSFVHGQDAAPHLDYPSLLQQRFRTAGITNVEVLNFGQNWHGLAQTWMLWDGAARPMGCDFALLGPMGFFSDRDLSFNHGGDAFPYYLHSLLVPDGTADGLKRIDVRGETYRQRMADYYRFWPKARYLKYDRQPPPLLRALLPGGQTIDNPFYFGRGVPVNALADDLYRRLLLAFAGSAPQTLLLHFNPVYPQLAGRLHRRTLWGYAVPPRELFPYTNRSRHLSGYGNAYVADLYWEALLGRVPATAWQLAFSDAEPAQARLELTAFRSLQVTLDGRPAGELHAFPPIPGMHVLSGADIAAGDCLLWLTAADRSHVEGFAFVVPCGDTPGHLVLQDGQGAAQGEWPLQWLDGGRLLGLHLPDSRFEERDVTLRYAPSAPLSAERLQLRYRGQLLLEAVREGRHYRFLTSPQRPLRVVALEDTHHDLAQGEAGGRVGLQLETADGHRQAIEFGHWRREPIRLPAQDYGWRRQWLDCEAGRCRIVRDDEVLAAD